MNCFIILENWLANKRLQPTALRAAAEARAVTRRIIAWMRRLSSKMSTNLTESEEFFDALVSHPFVKIAFRNAIEVSRTVEGSCITEVEVRYTRSLDEYEHYVITVGHTLAHFLSLCEQMKYAVHFLSSFNPSRQVKIKRSNYIQYNVENYLIRTQSLMDRALKLVNAVFYLRIAPRKCNFDTIAKNTSVRKTAVSDKLGKLRDILGKYREERNIVVHHEAFQENDLREMELLYLAVELSSDGIQTQDLRNMAYRARNLAGAYVKRKKREFSEFNGVVFREICTLFDLLHPVYIQLETTLRIKCSRATQKESA